MSLSPTDFLDHAEIKALLQSLFDAPTAYVVQGSRQITLLATEATPKHIVFEYASTFPDGTAFRAYLLECHGSSLKCMVRIRITEAVTNAWGFVSQMVAELLDVATTETEREALLSKLECLALTAKGSA